MLSCYVSYSVSSDCLRNGFYLTFCHRFSGDQYCVSFVSMILDAKVCDIRAWLLCASSNEIMVICVTWVSTTKSFAFHSFHTTTERRVPRDRSLQQSSRGTIKVPFQIRCYATSHCHPFFLTSLVRTLSQKLCARGENFSHKTLTRLWTVALAYDSLLARVKIEKSPFTLPPQSHSSDAVPSYL